MDSDSESDRSLLELKIKQENSPNKDVYLFDRREDEVMIDGMKQIRKTLECTDVPRTSLRYEGEPHQKVRISLPALK